MYKTVIAGLLVVVTGVFALQVALTYTNTELYNWLDGYLQKRKEQWFLPPPEGTWQTDISAEICPQISAEALDEVMAKHPFFMTTHLPSKQMGLPGGARSWNITRAIGFLNNQSLSIYLAPGGYCEARYRHVK